jgi:hypothetical protein
MAARIKALFLSRLISMSQPKPGQTVKCTIIADPITPDRTQTVARLMRMDPTHKRALRKAQRVRKQRLWVHNRGNRDWVAREVCARIVRPAKGQSFTMVYSANFAADIAGLKDFLKIEAV